MLLSFRNPFILCHFSQTPRPTLQTTLNQPTTTLLGRTVGGGWLLITLADTDTFLGLGSPVVVVGGGVIYCGIARVSDEEGNVCV